MTVIVKKMTMMSSTTTMIACASQSSTYMAQAVAQWSEEMEDKNNNNNKPSSVESQPRKKLKLPSKTLGDIPSHTRHMIVPSSLKDGIEYASTLQPLDYAFILRSNGTWTYAVVCDISTVIITTVISQV